MSTRLLFSVLALLCIAGPGWAYQPYQIGLVQVPIGYCGTAGALSTGTVATINQSSSVAMVSSYQVLVGSGGPAAIYTQSTMSCQLGVPGGACLQIFYLLSLIVGDRQIVVHIP
ncbi:MAG: hypothetical protein QHH07_00815 [Sedimentisphaerales bacterium]|jgi:hypothetical protein|nr:hypothetical protein [Sedimentisphaerales bacterium]